jgi:hypothetical protein
MRCTIPPVLALVVAAACADPASTGPASAVGPTQKKAPAPTGPVTVVMTHLDAPRGLAFGPEGALYVAEAGTTAITGPCVPLFPAARGQTCYSGTGAVSRLWKGEQSRILSGLPSMYSPTTTDIYGPHDVGFQGRGNGFVSIGWGADPALRTSLGSVGAQFGTVHRFNPGGKLEMIADIAAFESAENPAGGRFDSNPFGLLAEPGRRFVTDAGGNSLVEIGGDGAVSLVATFAPILAPPGAAGPPSSEPVPTAVQRGPDGALYVSTLTGVPFRPGTAAIYRVVPGGPPQVHAGGFSFITDFAWGEDGSLYVLQFASTAGMGGPGVVIRVAPDNGARSTVIATLSTPTGITVGPDGALYVSNKGRLPAQGEVLRIIPAPAP